MATEAPVRLLTAEEFMKSDLGEGTFELVRGEVVEVAPPMPEHGVVCSNVNAILWNYGRRSGHGYALSNDSAVLTQRRPDTVRGPDVCFYGHELWPRSQVGTGIPPVPPDMVVEVYSPSNRPGEILEKVSEYLRVGVPLVWVVYPKNQTVAVYRRFDEPPVVLQHGDVIENVLELPGFRCSVAEFFL